MAKNEIARPKVILDGQQAEAELDKLTQKANRYRDAMLAAASVGDLKKQKDMARNLKQTNTEISNLKKEAFDVDRVLKNINGASFNEIATASRKAAAELKKMQQTDPGYAEAQKNAQLLKTKMSELSKQSGVNISSFEKLKTTVSGLLPAFGFAAIAAGAKYAFDKVVNSTDVLSTKWAVFTGGLRSGMNEFFRSIAVGDWSNFTENMRAAIKVGREYETMLDDIEEKGRALRIKEAQSRGEELRLEEALKNTGLSKSERLAAGQARIKLEDDLAKERVKIAQDTFDAELKVTMQQTRLSKDRLMEVVSDMDSETKAKAKAYLEQQSLYESTLKKNDQFKVAASRSGITENPFAKEIADSKAVLDSYPESVKVYAEAIKGVGSTTDEQLNKMVAGYEGLLSAQNSAAENTKRVRTQVNSLLAGKAENGKPSTPTDPFLAGKGEDGKPTTTTDPFTPDAEQPDDMTWITAMVEADTKKFAEKKRSEAEWTAFLDSQVNERLDVMAKEFELEKEIADAKKKLKDAAITDAVQSGMAAVENAKTVEEAGKAILNVIREQIRAYMAEAVTIAALKALKSVPFPINIIAAAVAGGAASLLFNTLIPEFYEGGYTGGTDKKKVAGVVHEDEYVIPSKGLQNPSIRKIVNIVDLARRDGTVATIDLPAVMNATGMLPTSRQSSVYTSKFPEPRSGSNGGEWGGTGIDAATAKELTDAIKAFNKKKLVIYTEQVKKDLDEWENISNNRGL